MDVYVDASADGTIAVLLLNKPLIYKGNSKNIQALEYEAIQKAYELYGTKCTIFSDNVCAIKQAIRNYKDIRIKKIQGGKHNPADRYTRRFRS
jgi:hypothetical protein